MPKGRNPNGENRLVLDESIVMVLPNFSDMVGWHRPFLNFSLRVATGTHYRFLDVLKAVWQTLSCSQEFTYISLTELSLPAL